MSYRIDFDRETADFLRHLHPVQKQKIKASLDVIARTPELGKILQRELSGLYSYRVGRYRIIYVIRENKKKIHVVAIGPRDSIYDEVLIRVKAGKKRN